jgi:methylmalonyl-CoA mutase
VTRALRLADRAPGAVRVVTAASLFDGHDASINIMRRILQAQGAEVIHLGHDRGVDEIVDAAVQEDAHAVCISSYQGGHMEYFGYLVERLRAVGAGHVRVYGGGGGVIVPDEIAALHALGVARIFSPEDGRRLGLEGMIRQILSESAPRPSVDPAAERARLGPDAPLAVARLISWLEEHGVEGGAQVASIRQALGAQRDAAPAPIVGFTGTGGAGKSSVVDEMLRRLRRDHPALTIGCLLVDPTRRRTGGALLGDRIRMNAIGAPGIYVRSLATRQAHLALSQAVRDAVGVLQAARFDLILVETAGIGQSDSEITELADLSVYVMTPEYGAPTQLEKIDMLDLADVVVLNKSDRHGAEDALRDVRKQWRRNRARFEGPDEAVPVYATIASRFGDAGTERLYRALATQLGERFGPSFAVGAEAPPAAAAGAALVPPARRRYLAEIAECVRGYRMRSDAEADRASDAWALDRALRAVGDADPGARAALERRRALAQDALAPETRREIEDWPALRARYTADTQSYAVRGRVIPVENHVETLSGSRVPRVAVPALEEWGSVLRFLRRENVPGAFPFTAGVFPFKREDEEPTRMFAGEGTPERTNRRFHLLAAGQGVARLSTAFDSVTLYGRDPHERPDVWGKVGNSGVSVCTVDDAKKLYSGFDLCDPRTSVSMTINGPAPMILAFFLHAAIDQQVERYLRESGRLEQVRARFSARGLPRYQGELPPGHDGLGLGLLGIAGHEAVDADTYERIRADVLRRVRGTVQADILKEDQAQNTCIFSTEFALRAMGDVQEWFVARQVRNFYSVSISGYHIAEAGANPITQLAFTLANGFTYVEAYRARGMDVDAFAPNFSFFFSNGLDAEYSVIGRVARRIWAVAMRERYGAGERSQKLKYHVQTSGRSLHAQEMAFNDIRTTLQALTAIEDHCNSLHTNAFDEAVTTPTQESVRRAVAIQLIVNRELGLTKNENPIQGAYVIEQLTDLVEEAVLREFERLAERGGVLGAMETLYQRGRIQEESLRYEERKHSGQLPIVGVNTFLRPDGAVDASLAPAGDGGLVRSSDAEKRAQLDALRAFQNRHADAAPAALAALQRAVVAQENCFDALMHAAPVASLGQISDALFEVGGRYRRAM